MMTELQVRCAFWQAHPEHRAEYLAPDKTQTDYPLVVQLAFADFLIGLRHDLKISLHTEQTATLGAEPNDGHPQPPSIRQALEAFVAAYVPADGSQLQWEALNEAYQAALLALGITHDSRMAADTTDESNPLANDMR